MDLIVLKNKKMINKKLLLLWSLPFFFIAGIIYAQSEGVIADDTVQEVVREIPVTAKIEFQKTSVVDSKKITEYTTEELTLIELKKINANLIDLKTLWLKNSQ